MKALKVDLSVKIELVVVAAKLVLAMQLLQEANLSLL
jgi:hypothetical protein